MAWSVTYHAINTAEELFFSLVYTNAEAHKFEYKVILPIDATRPQVKAAIVKAKAALNKAKTLRQIFKEEILLP
jgi:hypothetical protein